MLKKKRNKTFIIIICVIIILCTVVFGGILIFLNKINTDNYSKVKSPSFDESIKLPESLTQHSSEVEKNYLNKDIYSQENVTNILLCGVDASANINHWGRSDSMMILSLNNNDNTIRLASLSRAVYTKIEGYKSTRLSAAYSYGGPKLLVDTIEKNYKIKIDNYLCVDFEAFKKIIDAFGGIEMYLNETEATGVEKTLQYSEYPQNSNFSNNGAGNYILDSSAALAYARVRYIDTDRQRTGRQRKIIEKIFEKTKTISISQAIQIANDVLPYITTDFTKSDIISQCTKIPRYVKYKTMQTVIPDKSSELTMVDGIEILFVDWDETISYAKSFFYPTSENATN